MAANVFADYGNRNITNEKPCRTCTDFRTWAKLQKDTHNKETKPSKAPQEEIPEKRDDLQCPLDKDELGRKTWSFLHTMAAYYPEKPSIYQENDVKQFFSTFSRLYPCSFCAEDFQKLLKVSPPATKSQEELSQWLCKIHNSVNERLGKSLFDCSRVNERWRDGWKDGSCDY